eukprot:CAMPEP_0183728896 /NCGR_PEP_ID=MMETSP0737-20130205/29195_1 /TAXON_ID=385413 /ORGANISM="Thalassiosira miniscula, Strain CCMP1093" /LENGTH=300 /DNA_ID=CAMNT_0025960961 /DNA_START=409 /DNA_END=1311 /DNA_ORIENTATION=-
MMIARQQNIRLMSSVAPSSDKIPSTSHTSSSKREIHSDTTKLSYAAQPTYYPEGSTAKEAPQEETSSGMADRFKITAEVTISKIFPAGFGWQSSSIVAEEYLGYAPDSVAFALTTGLGDAIGVMVGHCAYFAAKKSITGDEGINMERETQTGLLLASAAFCSGTVWQPLVDVLQAANLSFGQVFAGTWVGCGTAFYLGLRGARTILSGPCKYIHEPTYENSTTDKSLSVAIGGATGFFVGTDTAYLPAQNFLINAVGIHDTTPALAGCVIAGSSTSLGFLSAQTSLNAIYPAGKLWNDGK